MIVASLITPRHLAVLAFLEAEREIQPDELAHRLSIPIVEVEAICRDLAAEGLFGPDIPQ
jgi:DNA-binding MarR family transcriptional regulator